jgi:hypothetical protein
MGEGGKGKVKGADKEGIGSKGERQHWSQENSNKRQRRSLLQGMSSKQKSNGGSSGHKRAIVYLLTNQISSIPNKEMLPLEYSFSSAEYEHR